MSDKMHNMFLGAAIALGIVGWVGVGWIIGTNQTAYECQMMGQFYVGKTVYDCEVARQPLTVPKTKPPGQ